MRFESVAYKEGFRAAVGIPLAQFERAQTSTDAATAARFALSLAPKLHATFVTTLCIEAVVLTLNDLNGITLTPDTLVERFGKGKTETIIEFKCAR